MSGQDLDVAGWLVSLATLQGFQDVPMQPTPSLLQKARVSHLVGQGMLERVLVLRKEPRLVEEPGRLEPNEPFAQLLIGSPADLSEQGNRDVPTNHGRRLEQSLLLRLEPVDPGGEQRLHRCRDVNLADIRCEAVRTPFAEEGSCLRQGMDTLLQEEGVSLGALDEEALQRCKAGVLSHQALEECLCTLRHERSDTKLADAGLAPPAGVILGPIVHEGEHRHRRHAFQQAVQEGLCLRIDPVKILEHEHEGLHAALATQEALESIEGDLAALRRLEAPEPVLLGKNVEEPEDGRENVSERVVQGEHVSGDLGADRPQVVTVVDPEVATQKIDDRAIARGLPIGKTARLKDSAAADAIRMRQLMEKS